MKDLTDEPIKFVKPFLRTKRRIQRRCSAQVETIAKGLNVPFASNEDHAREILRNRQLKTETPKSDFRNSRFEVRDPQIGRGTPFAPARIWRAPQQQQQLQAA
jgi:hypothetical protein